jgi:L-methionine (R)-S-oxide reductase
MAEELLFPKDASREQIYQQIIPQIHSLNKDEPDFVAKLANTAAALKQAFNFFLGRILFG